MDRQDREDHIRGIRLILAAQGIVDQISVGKHHALTLSRRARGEENRGTGIRINVRKAGRIMSLKNCGDILFIRFGFCRQTDTLRDLRTRFPDALRQGFELFVIEQNRRVGPVQMVAGIFLRQLRINGNRHIAGNSRAEQACKVCDAAGSDQSRMYGSIRCLFAFDV